MKKVGILSAMLEVLLALAPMLAAALLAGGCAGTLGVYVLGLRAPFLAVCTAHAAMAGAVWGPRCGLPPFWSAFAGACLGGAALGALLRRRDLDQQAALGLLFSLTLGLAFVGLATAPGPKGEIFGLLWGSPAFATWTQVARIGVVCALVLAFLARFHRELTLVMFSRALAAVRLPETLLLTAFLVVASAAVTVNLEVVGGLLVYSLICNPALAALRWAGSVGRAACWSGLLGAAIAVGGVLGAYAFDWPVGCCTVLLSSLIVIPALVRPRNSRPDDSKGP